jgi:hypothetical protein
LAHHCIISRRSGEEQILRWAELHLQRSGAWPRYHSGPAADVAGETWSGLESALRLGKRGLPGGSSLAKLLEQRRKDTFAAAPCTEAEAVVLASRE